MTETNDRSQAKHIVASRTIVAIAVFASLSVGMGALSLGRLAPTDVPYPTWTSWAIKGFESESTLRPDIVFLGSSLLVNPIGNVDADERGENVDATSHRRSLFFEKRFRELSGKSVSTYNFALPGAMPSDAYLITRFLLKEPKAPRVIVYGVAPRDLLENTLPSPAATDPFRYLSRLGDYSGAIDRIAPDFFTRLDFEIGRALYTYGIREDLKTASARLSRELMDTVLPVNPEQEYSIHKRMQILPEYHPYEIQRNEAFFRPSSGTEEEFRDNTQEYRDRYRRLKLDVYRSQLAFLKDTFAMARKRRIECVLVSMPITKGNRELLSADSLKAYRDGIETVCAETGASLVDMDRGEVFSQDDFADGVHLRSAGGKKFLDLLARNLATNEAVVAAILPRKPAVAEIEESRL